jgi:hypothetical protein
MADPSSKAPPTAQAIDFVTFCLSLASSAFIHLGDAPHPDGTEARVNLVLAKQTIDILAMLEEKTKGNLSAEETRFLENLLVDLRLRYVSRSSGKRE